MKLLLVILLLPLSVCGQDLIGGMVFGAIDNLVKADPFPLYVLQGHEITKSVKKEKFSEIETLNIAISKDSKNPEWFIKRGIVKDFLEINDGAIEDFEHAIRLGTKNKEVLFHLAKVLMERGHRSVAMSAIVKYIEACPDSAKGFLYKGLIVTYNPKSRLNSLRERCIESIPSFDKAIALDSGYRTALILRGYAHQFLEQLDLAEADYKQVVQDHPDDALVYVLLGKLYEDKKDKSNACINFKQAKLYADVPERFINRNCN